MIALLRQEIDTVDCELVDLLLKRQKLVEKVASEKTTVDDIYDQTREEQVRANVLARAETKGLDARMIRWVINSVLEGSRHLQRRIIEARPVDKRIDVV